jgi:hypothetical protein
VTTEAPDSKESLVGANRGNLDEDLCRGRRSPAWISFWDLWMITLPRSCPSKGQIMMPVIIERERERERERELD